MFIGELGGFIRSRVSNTSQGSDTNTSVLIEAVGFC